MNGKKAFTKALCFKCHRYNGEGEGVGPDLTGLRKRFQRKEIIESVILPSLVISDQYKPTNVETAAGLTYNGLVLPQSNASELVLLLSDGKKLNIPRGDIERQKDSKVSVMPEALFKDLSLKEIADLFAYLETSKDGPDPVKK